MNPLANLGRGGGPPPPLKPPGMATAGAVAPSPDEGAAPTAGGEIPREPLSPEALCFREAYKKCKTCKYRPDGDCLWLQMPVADDDSCEAYGSGAGSGVPEDEEDEYEPEPEEEEGQETEEVGAQAY